MNTDSKKYHDEGPGGIDPWLSHEELLGVVRDQADRLEVLEARSRRQQAIIERLLTVMPYLADEEEWAEARRQDSEYAPVSLAAYRQGLAQRR